MADRDERLLALATALSDGSDVDWDAVESSAASDSERRQVRQLRLVRQITDAQSGSSIPLAQGAAHESLLHPAGQTETGIPSVTWGPLRVIEKIGHGRFGDVYRAWDPRLERDVALKLSRHRPSHTDADALAVEEGRLLARVRHPNVAAVYGAERIEDRLGVWMELIRGRTLEEELLAEGPFDTVKAARTGADICRALGAVHRAGLLHRDVKAQNVMRDEDGRVVLMDFGTGREIDTDYAPELAGTPLYLAPEVLDGRPPSVQSDLYSVGVLLHHLLTGGFPVSGSTLSAIRDAHKSGVLGHLDVVLTPVPSALRPALARALAPDPDGRFSSAADMETALVTAVAEAPVSTPRRPSWDARLILAAGVVAAATALVAYATWAARAGDGGVERVCDDCEALGDASVSNDGSRLTYVDARQGDIIVRDLSSGKSRALGVNAGGFQAATDIPFMPVLSPDGGLIAYATLPQSDSSMPELRVVRSDAGESPRLLHRGGDGMAIPLAWSPDGRSILVMIASDAAGSELAWISVHDGSRSRITRLPPEFEQGQPTASVSPDGRFIAYGVVELRPRRNGAPVPVYTIRADGAGETPLATVAGSSSYPRWTPDGSRVLFRSDFAGTMDIWSVPVTEGRPTARPTLVRRDIGSAVPVGMARNGRYYFYESPVPIAYSEVWRLSPEKPAAASLARTLVGSNPTWSPEGERIALVRPTPSNRKTRAIVVHALASGDEQLYERTGLIGGVPLWFGDGKGLLIRVAEEGLEYWYRLDLTRGAFIRLARNRGDPHFLTHRSIRALAPDGKTLYLGTYASADKGAPIDRIVAVDLASGAHRLVFTLPDADERLPTTAGEFALAISPDGRTLAMHTVTPMTGASRVATLGVDGTGYQVRYGPFIAPDTVAERLVWVRDGQSLLFTMAGAQRANANGRNMRVMRLPLDGGVAQFTGLEADWMFTLDASPDGSSVVFGGPETAAGRSGVWALDLSRPTSTSPP